MAIFNNSATLSYNGIVTNSNTITGELLEVLSAAKTAVVDEYAANKGVTYVVTITNAGGTAFTGLTVTDNLGAYPFSSQTLYPLTYTAGSVTYYVNGVLQSAPAVTAGPPLVIRGISVPAGGNATLIYEATANQYAPLGANGSIQNQATITGPGISTPLTASETVTPQAEPSLTISKSLCPETVTENGQLTYTFVIQNAGNTAATAGDNVTLTDTFDPILNPIAVTFNGTPWTSPDNYSYSTVTGLFSTVAGQITVPATTYTQDPTSGNWIVTPGVSTLVVTGTV